MELSKDTRLMELATSPATTSYGHLLDEQKGLFQNQIEKLQEIVATQCKLTGVNPLSQEMAASALSIKIGKRPRDLLNPKAVKYMQLVFSMKDAISKRETREISAQFGVTVTQVRDFFAGQRTRVRKFVRLSRERTDTTASDLIHNGITPTSSSDVVAEPVPLGIVAPISIDEGPSCSKRPEGLSDLTDSDKNFVENIFGSMRKEESFSGQIKLMRSILRITNPSVLNWFLMEGGLMILATWLSEAAKEEQTSFLLVILKLLDYLPLSKALPVHMSAILQSVNRLRFYRASDISNRARPLLSKWSKMLGKNLASKKNNASKSASDLQDEMLLKQSISEVMGNESWHLKKENHEDALRLCDNPGSPRKLDSAQPLKMLMAPGDDLNKKRGGFPQTRERRKVQLVEHPSQVRSPQVARSSSAMQSRPLSADDIQKAKMRAQFMQNKHGKAIMPPDDKIKPESEKRNFESEDKDKDKATTVNSSHASLATSVSNANVETEADEQRRFDDSSSVLSNPLETFSLNSNEPPCKKSKRVQIPWQMPPEVRSDEAWSVGDGAQSKEVEVQRNRIRREREVVYKTLQEIPSNPREPWDREMDCDDSLTPIIPIEQLPDSEPLEAPPSIPNHSSETVAPDFELLAELLKNPELVFALTSGQAGNLSSEETVKLLDRIKANGVGSFGSANSKVEVSLPSPTPSSDPVPNGAKPDFSRNPFSRQQGNEYQGMASASTMVQSQIPAAAILAPQPPATLPQYANMVVQTQHMHHQSMPNSSTMHFTSEMVLNANTAANLNRATVWPDPPSRSATPPNPNPNPNPQSLYLQEPQGYEPNHPYYHHPQAGEYVLQPLGVWGGRNNVSDRPEYESWSPENSPSRRHEHLQGHYRNNPSVNLRNGYRHGKANEQNSVRPSGYQDGGDKRWQDRRR